MYKGKILFFSKTTNNSFINSHLLWIKYFLLIILKSDIWRKYSCICQTKLLAKRAWFTVCACAALLCLCSSTALVQLFYACAALKRLCSVSLSLPVLASLCNILVITEPLKFHCIFEALLNLWSITAPVQHYCTCAALVYFCSITCGCATLLRLLVLSIAGHVQSYCAKNRNFFLRQKHWPVILVIFLNGSIRISLVTI